MAQAARDELTILEAAQLVHRSPETVRRWAWTGRLKARKNGKRLMVLRRDVEALAGAEATSLSLADWAKLADKVLHRRRRGGRSSADLVLADRRERYGDRDASR